MNADDGPGPRARTLVLLVAAAIVLPGCINTQNSPGPKADTASDNPTQNTTSRDGEQGGQNQDPPPSQGGQTENQTAEPDTTVSRAEYTSGVTQTSFLGYRCDIVEATDNTGGACFELPNGTLNVTLEIDDDMSPSVGAYWYLVNTSDGQSYSGRFCDNTTASLTTSNGTRITADAILVSVKGPYKGNLICYLEEGGVHAATTGTITAAITYLPETE